MYTIIAALLPSASGVVAASLSLPASGNCFPTTEGSCISLAPLLLWARVGMVCALLLVGEALLVAAIPLAHARSARSRRLALVALAPLAAAIGSALLADRAWAAYQYYATLDLGPRPSFGAIQHFVSLIQSDTATVQTLGWLMVMATVELVALGVWLLVRSLRAGRTRALRRGATQHAAG
jgi:hypothetical protein